NGAAPARDHAPGHRLAGEEAGKAGHFPDLEILARRLVEDAARHVGADIENHHLDWPDVTFNALHQLGHLLFTSRIGSKPMGLAAFTADRLQQRLQFFQAAPSDTGDVPLTGETPGNGTTGGVTGPDDQSDLPVLVHGPSSG